MASHGMGPTEAYPLQWPPNRKRTGGRLRGRFQKARSELTVAEALKRLHSELGAIRARMPVVSSNLELRLDGLPRSNRPEPADRGVAVYFQLDGKPTCLPCDTYTKVAQNIAAIAAHIQATRAIERHGVATVAEMFTGFVSLPAPGANWWDVLHCRPDASREVIEAQFRRLARDRHPDAGGSDAMMSELNAARAQALKAASP